MARKKSSLVQDILEITAVLPWWGGVILAAFSYIGLSLFLAEVPATQAPSPSNVGQFVVANLKYQLASIAHYMLPALFLMGAAISAWRARAKAALLSNAIQTDGASLNGITWREFELLVGEAFKVKGYAVSDSGGKGADGGIDLTLKKDGETFLVQCKQWRAVKVGVTVIRELYGVMAATGSTGGFVVTSGRFTAEATAFAQGRNITLLDGAALNLFIGAVPQSPQPDLTAPQLALPNYPTCGGSMVERSAKRGPNAGAQFLGCASYPACRGTAALT